MSCAVCGGAAATSHLGSPLCTTCKEVYAMGSEVDFGGFGPLFGTICAAIAILAAIAMMLSSQSSPFLYYQF